MKRFLISFFLAVFCTATVGAATSSISRTIPTKNAKDNAVESATNTPNTNRSTVSRVTGRGTQKNTKSKTNVTSRSVNARNTNARATLSDGVNTVGRNARTEAASINSNPALRRAGVVLRASTAEVGGRATLSNGQQTGSNIDEQVKHVQSRASVFGLNKQKNVTAESLANAKDIMEKTSDLNNVCQEQYNECMDQYCAVVDANQKRCSCSSNLAKYAKAQEAVENANAELNDVAQQIRYVGLSADEIRAIMSATEAELTMSKTKDKTKTRSLLDDIADMIEDPTASIDLTGSNGISSLLDMDFDFSSDSSDTFSLDMFNSSSNDISSKRGTALYKEAKKRCKTVLNNCKNAGGTEDQISGNYDLAIAKDCIAYEQGLEKLNTTLKNNVRSANLMLQKARLAVLQNKNEYDIRGCVGALETCMLDDMVCGEGYLKCVDPTKVYIDENGTVVLGRNLPNITNMMTEYNNTKINADFIKGSSNDNNCAKHDGACIVNYLMTKIGTGATVKDGGLCRAVLDKCQDYTYVKQGKNFKYNPYNDVVVSYIQRAMVNIKAAQAKIIADYASTCMADVQECYNQQNTQITSWTSAANVQNVYRVMTGACYNVALTCGYAIFAYDKEMGQNIENPSLSEQDRRLKLIEGVSEIFYQSFLCPENSEYTGKSKTEEMEAGNNVDNYVNEICVCKDGYKRFNGACVITSCDGDYYWYNGQCLSSCPSGTYKNTDPENKLCVASCEEGEYKDTVNRACVAACTDSAPYIQNGMCVSSCNSDLVILDDGTTKTCVTSCPEDYPYVNGRECVNDCPAGKYRDVANNQCVTSCPNGTFLYEVEGICVAACPNNTHKCSSLQMCVSDCSSMCGTAVYSYNGGNGSSCVSSCPVGNPDNDGVCASLYTGTTAATICLSPSYAYNGGCVQNCPSGTNVCVSSGRSCVTDCSGCSGKNYALNGTCVASCTAGTYSYNGRCETSCPSGYNKCPSSHSCVTDCSGCIPGPYKENGQCVSSCSVGSANSDNECATFNTGGTGGDTPFTPGE